MGHPQSGEILSLTERYLVARFGERPFEASERRAFETRVRDIQSSAKKGVEWLPVDVDHEPAPALKASPSSIKPKTGTDAVSTPRHPTDPGATEAGGGVQRSAVEEYIPAAPSSLDGTIAFTHEPNAGDDPSIDTSLEDWTSDVPDDDDDVAFEEPFEEPSVDVPLAEDHPEPDLPSVDGDDEPAP
jgi:hypothetical protein